MDRVTDPAPPPVAVFELARALAKYMAAVEFGRRLIPVDLEN